jgi:hypothetical protein
MRRAMSPATCTLVTSSPEAVRRWTALRSLSVDALSRSAFTKSPGKYQTFSTVPSTGERFECTLKTFMKTLILTASRFRYSSRALPTCTMRPSAGESTSPSPDGTSRGGSRKNCSTKSAASQKGADHQPASAVTTAAATTVPAR